MNLLRYNNANIVRTSLAIMFKSLLQNYIIATMITTCSIFYQKCFYTIISQCRWLRLVGYSVEIIFSELYQGENDFCRIITWRQQLERGFISAKMIRSAFLKNLWEERQLNYYRYFNLFYLLFLILWPYFPLTFLQMSTNAGHVESRILMILTQIWPLTESSQPTWPVDLTSLTPQSGHNTVTKGVQGQGFSHFIFVK
jgi:hypothetical protein